MAETKKTKKPYWTLFGILCAIYVVFIVLIAVVASRMDHKKSFPKITDTNYFAITEWLCVATTILLAIAGIIFYVFSLKRNKRDEANKVIKGLHLSFDIAFIALVGICVIFLMACCIVSPADWDQIVEERINLEAARGLSITSAVLWGVLGAGCLSIYGVIAYRKSK